MKKIISFVLILSFLFVFPIESSANENGSFTTEISPTLSYEKLTVTVIVKDNPGIWSYNMKIGYNADALEYVGSEIDYNVWKKSEICSVVPTNNPLIIYAECNSCLEDNENSGNVVIFNFKIKDHTKPFDITYDFDQNGIFSCKDIKNTVKMSVINKCPDKDIAGDVDLDGEITVSDSLLLKKHLAGKAVTGELSLDCDRSGDINAKDRLYIAKVLAYGN